MKRWKAWLVTVLMMAFLCAPVRAISADTQTPVYTESDLIAIRENLNGSFRLMKDVTLTDVWKPLGYDENSAFTGTFDGGGHTIRGLSVKGSEIYAGLFGYNKGIVRNLTVVDGSVDVKVGSYDQMHSGLLVGYNDGGTVENCHTIGGRVSATSYSFNDNRAGGVVGFSKYGTIRSCQNSASVTAQNTLTTPYNEFFTGGIVGTAIGTTIVNCCNNGLICGGRTGGVVGWLLEGTVSQCYNVGTVSTQLVERGYSGGVVGDSEDATVRDCYNAGKVTAETAVSVSLGGIAGRQQGGTIERAYSIGELSAVVLSGSGSCRVGGCVGETDGAIRACYQANYLPLGGGTAYPLSALCKAAALREFDFSEVWTMEGRTSYPYPELRAVEMTADFAAPTNTTLATTTVTGSTHRATAFTYPSASVSTAGAPITTITSATTAPSLPTSARPSNGWWMLLIGAALLVAGVIVCLVVVVRKRT